MKLRIKTGDTVKILTGKDRGKTGKVIQTFPRLNRVAVEGVNTAKRHLRTQRSGEKGQVVEFSMPIHASNVAVVGEDGKARRHKKREAAKTTSKAKAASKPAKTDAKAE